MMPKAHLPALVMAADTGSVAMYIMPKAKPPSTMCQYQGMANIGLVALPIRLKSPDSTIMPSITPATIRQAAMPVSSSRPPPSRMASVLASPTAPGMKPRKASVQESPCWVRAATPPSLAMPNAVAPE